MTKKIAVILLGAVLLGGLFFPKELKKVFYEPAKRGTIKGVLQSLRELTEKKPPTFSFSSRIKDKLSEFNPPSLSGYLQKEIKDTTQDIKEKALVKISSQIIPDKNTTPSISQNKPSFTLSTSLVIKTGERIYLQLENNSDKKQTVNIYWHNTVEKIILPPYSRVKTGWSWQDPGIYTVKTDPPTQEFRVKVEK